MEIVYKYNKMFTIISLYIQVTDGAKMRERTQYYDYNFINITDRYIVDRIKKFHIIVNHALYRHKLIERNKEGQLP